MAILLANSSGNFNTAATWDTVANTPSIHASTNVSVTTAGVNSVTFTAPNTTNAVTGVAVYVGTYPAAGRDWTAELVESGVGTGSIATILQTDMPTDQTSASTSWLYFRLATPYTYTTTGAGAYRWNFKSTTANSGSMGADGTSTTLVCIASTDNRNSAPTTSDQCWILAHNATSPAITVTVDGTTADIRGSGTNRGIRQTAMGLMVGGSLTQSLAIIKFDTAASASLSVTGMTLVNSGGELQMGTVASPYPAAYTATWTNRQGAGGTNTGVYWFNNARVILQGASRSYYSTTYVSGTGVAASPLVVSDSVDWNVGDRIAVTATSANATNYQETEYKFIITKNSATSYVLSDTSGGSENAFTYTHNTNAKVLLLTRNVIVTSTVQTQNVFSAPNSTSALVSGYTDIDWSYIKNIGGAGGTATLTTSPSIYGIYIPPSSYTAIDYCVFDTVVTYGIINSSRIPQTYTGNIFCASGAGSVGATASGLGINGVGHTFVDHYFIGNRRQGVEYRGINCTFTNPHFSGNNTDGIADNGAFYLANGAPVVVTTPNIHCNRIAGVTLNTTSNSIFSNGNIGGKGANTVDVAVVADSANKILFDNCVMGSSTTVSGYLDGADGATLIAFDTMNGTVNNHKWYTEYGSAQSTGAGLSDTNVRTSGTLNVRLNPENSSTGFKYEYQILAVPSRAVFALGFIERNAAFATDTCLVELFLPGSTVADASQTMATTVGTYLPFSIAATYNGTVSRYATVRISAKTTTASAYLYIADLFNGTNNITNFNTWYQGQPSMIMFEQLGDAAAVWAVPISTMTTSGTIGYFIVKKLLSIAKFIALR